MEITPLIILIGGIIWQIEKRYRLENKFAQGDHTTWGAVRLADGITRSNRIHRVHFKKR